MQWNLGHIRGEIKKLKWVRWRQAKIGTFFDLKTRRKLAKSDKNDSLKQAIDYWRAYWRTGHFAPVRAKHFSWYWINSTYPFCFRLSHINSAFLTTYNIDFFEWYSKAAIADATSVWSSKSDSLVRWDSQCQALTVRSNGLCESLLKSLTSRTGPFKAY